MCGRNSRAGPPRETMIPNFSNRDQQKRRNANFIDLHPPPKRERIFSNRRVVFRTSVERGFSGEGSNVFATNDKRRFRFFSFSIERSDSFNEFIASRYIYFPFCAYKLLYIWRKSYHRRSRKEKEEGRRRFFNLKFRLPIDNCR